MPTVRTPRLRVLLLDHTGELGGAELALVRLCAALDLDLLDVRALLFADGPLRGALEAVGVPTEVLPLDHRVAGVDRHAAGGLGTALRSGRRALAFALRLARAIRAADPDVVHTTSLKSDLIGLVAAGLARRPLVWHVHDRISTDYLPRSMVALIQAGALLPDAVIGNSRATVETLAPRQVTIAYPGFAPEQVLPEPAARHRTTSPSVGDRATNPPVVGLLGRISPTKGQLELVRAAPIVLERHPDTRFRIVGSPMFGAEDYAREVRAEAHRLKVEDRIDWVGFTAEPARELDGFDVAVHASPVPEPFGQVIVEAMIRAVPVVATRAGGALEIIRPGRADLGILVEPADPRSLAEGICAVLGDPRSTAARAADAYAVALERFPVTRSAATVTGVWERAAAGGRRRRPWPRPAPPSAESPAAPDPARTAPAAPHGRR
jgi:glycosyltransferase involved in cell wall biosynthesis